MASIGENAYGGNLTVNKLTYATLDPPIGGFVNNPLTGNLDCGGNDLTNGGDFNCNTLNYTNLNPPINPGITNPLAAPLLCSNQNIGVGTPADRANEVRAVTLTGDNSTLGTASATTLTTTGAVTAGGSTYSVNGNIVGTSTVGGRATLTSGVDIPVTAPANTIDNITNCNALLSTLSLAVNSTAKINNPAVIGSIGTPYNFQTLPTPILDVTNKSRGVVYGYDAGGNFISFEVETGINKPLENGSVWVDSANASSSGSVPVSLEGKQIRQNAGTLTKFDITIELSGTTNLNNYQRINVLFLPD